MGKSPHDHSVQEDVVKLFFTYIENYSELDPTTQFDIFSCFFLKVVGKYFYLHYVNVALHL